jgi:hypothetical protein
MAFCMGCATVVEWIGSDPTHNIMFGFASSWKGAGPIGEVVRLFFLEGIMIMERFVAGLKTGGGHVKTPLQSFIWASS